MFVQSGTCIMRQQPRPDGGTDVIFYWTSTSGGAVTAYLGSDELPQGYLYSLSTDPIDGPTDDYDITLEDGQGVDILRAIGTNRDTTNSEVAYAVSTTAVSLPILEANRGPFMFKVASAGNAKSGTAILAFVTREEVYGHERRT